MAVTHRTSPDHFDDHDRGDMTDVSHEDQSAYMGLAERLDRLHWADQGMCHGKTELFFARPGERDGRRNRREALAKAYCAVCPVQRVCLLAGRLGREHGLWGGENDEERAAAGFGPRSPSRRAVAKAARDARQDPREINETVVRLIAELDDMDGGDVSSPRAS